MAGAPKTRERMKQAEAAADDVKARLEGMRIALIRRGLDPNEFDPAGAVFEAAQLESYAPELPLAVARLASAGQSIEEIRITLGFTPAQQEDWCEQYLDFAAQIGRVRAREEAFWQGQARQAAKTGDRTGFTAISTLIQKRFMDNTNNQSAQRFLHVRQSPLPPKPSDEEA